MISVIVPVYNGEKYIRRCIDSILKSSYSNYEIIIVDDGSTDKTVSVLSDIINKNKQIKFYKKNNGGSASARNFGLNKAHGDYIMFVDADDYVEKDFLGRMHDAITSNKLDLVECDFYIIDDKKKLNGAKDKKEIDIINNTYKLNEFCDRNTYLKSSVLWNKIYKRELFNGIKFVENKSIDDEFVIYKLLYKAKKIGILHECLYNYCVDNNSQMRHAPSLKKLDNIEALEQQIAFFDKKKLVDIKEKLLFRYYRTIIDDIYYVKKYFPGKKEVLEQLTTKRKGWYKSLSCNGKSLKEKTYLLLTRFIPRCAYYIRDITVGKNKVCENKGV